MSGAGVRAAGEAAAGGPVRVAFQGERGAYSEEAIARHWGAAADPVPARTCADVAALVAAGAADYGVLAAENTLAGSVAATADALAAAPEVAAAGEVVLPVHHCVLGVPGATLAGLRVVESHPVALAQCGRFLGRHPHVTARAGYDTAGAARDVAERGDARVGAVAGRGAAARYGLAVLAADVEDRPDNQTRFLVIARAGSAAVAAPPAGAPARTALLAVPPNVPGALVRLLLPFAEAGLNLNTVESRPTGDPWAYRFYVEVEHAAGDARLDAALRAARRAAGDGPGALRVLGTFARAAAPGAGPNRTPAGVGAAAPAGAGR